MRTKIYRLLFFLFFLLFFNKSYSQSYGLGFYSHEVVQDQRTGLDLSPDKNLCFSQDFELCFDLNFFPKRDDYFGYILRVVVSNKENIDLVYDKDSKEKFHFKVIIGDRFTKIAFNIPPEELFNKWNRVRLNLSIPDHKLTIKYGKYQSSADIALEKNACFKFLFGANEYKQFKTSDNPPMKIKDIRIFEGNIQKYYWPLNEYDGEQVNELIENNNGRTAHPLWIKKLHYEWQKIGEFMVNGPASFSFDQKSDLVYVVERDSLKTFSVIDSKISSVAYKNKYISLRGNHSIFLEDKKELLNFYIDQKTALRFDKKNDSWSQSYNPITPITDFWQFNKFYSQHDTSLYIIGGYGHFVYKNQIQKYNLSTGRWKDIIFTGDRFTPRYLAGLGLSGNGAYLIGGYGSSTGRQMLNPRNLYDLLFFDTKKKSITKIYDLNTSGEDFVFANSLVISKGDSSFFGLTFPRHRYNSELQLIKGSLHHSNFSKLGNKIPFIFHDINSFVDLFYSQSSNRFIAVTTFRDSTDHTKINIYALNNPPLIKRDAASKAANATYYVLGSLLFLAGIIALLFYRKIKKKQFDIPEESMLDKSNVLESDKMLIDEPNIILAPEKVRNSIFLFGDLQVYDDNGCEITKQFTPLIKELFLVIMLYTIRWERGISSDKLKELLWYDKSTESARNNRSVNIAKLKNILEQISTCSVSKETGYWRFNSDSAKVFIDYQKYIDIVKDKKNLNKQKIRELAQIIKRGAFLSIVNYEWLDPFKAEISNDIIDAYIIFSHSIKISEDPELLIEIANYIFYFDSVNEEAMVTKCKALVHMGKHSQAKNTYQDFCKEYKILYNDEFQRSFSHVLNSEL